MQGEMQQYTCMR